MIARTVRVACGRVAAVAAVALLVSSTWILATPAGAIPSRINGCLPLVVAKADVHAAAIRREGTIAVLIATLRARKDPWSLNAGQIGTLQASNSSVVALDARVQSTCYPTVAAFRTDATPLFTNFLVYWLRVPQTRGIEAADRLGEARALLGVVAGRLAAHVGSDAKAATDLATMNEALAAADSRLGTAPSPAPHIAALASLVPAADMTADDAAMETARADLFAARASLVAARVSGLKVVADLGG